MHGAVIHWYVSRRLVFMGRLARIILFLSLSAVGLFGQSTERSVDITERGLAQAVVIDSRSGAMTIRHPRSGVSVADARQTVLEYSVFVPCADEVTIAGCRPGYLKKFLTLVAQGSYGNRPVVRLEVDLLGLRKEGLAIPDELYIRLEWSTAMQHGRALQPPLGPPVINPDWQPAESGRRMIKVQEKPLEFINPTGWYHSARSFVRLETFRDGVAKVTAESVQSLTPFSSLDSIALFWRGVQQPIHIVDADQSSTFTAGDVIYFLGRRPIGDTTYLDECDTTSIFYLTGTHRGTERRRFRVNDTPQADSSFSSLQRRVHFERDTGYFHPGNGVDDDLGYLYTPRAALEGFYWTSLNARAQQSGQFPISFIAANSDSLVSYSATVVTTSDSKAYDPDHAVDVVFPGVYAPKRLEMDGYGVHTIKGTSLYWELPPVPTKAYIQATGFPERIPSNDWSSFVLVDAIEVSGHAASVAEYGRLDGYVKLDQSASLRIDNLPENGSVVIDTLRSEIGFPADFKNAFHVRAARWPYRNPSKPLEVVDGQFSLGVVISDDYVHSDSLRHFASVVVDPITLRPVLRLHETAEDLIKHIEQVDTALPLVVVQALGKPNDLVVRALRERGVVLDPYMLDEDGWIATTQGRFCDPMGGVSYHQNWWPNARATHGTAYLPLSRGEHYLVIGAGSGIETAMVRPATNGFLSRRDWSQGTDVIVVTHREHAAEARRWAAHREQFSKKQIVVVDIDEVLEAYGAGRHDPRAVRAFLRDAWQRSGARKPTHCVLIGSASWDVRRAVRGGNVDAVRVDQVPTYGRPSSDMWFGLLDDENDLATPELIVSRFPGTTALETATLVDKIIAADTVPYAPYHRRFLYGGGGEDGDSFCDIINRALRDEFGTGVVFVDPPLCIDTVVVCKTEMDHPGRRMRDAIAQGVGWVNFLGHGGTEQFDIDDWEPPQLNNEGRYPILASYSCLTGSYSSPSATCENAKYLFEPRKGSVVSLGSTGLQYISAAEFLHFRIHDVLLNTSLRDIGRLVYEAKSSFSRTNTAYASNTSMQFCILGDPFTRVRIDTAAELTISADRLRFTSPRLVEPILEDDSIMVVRGEIWNEGTATKVGVDVRMVRQFGARADTLTVRIDRGMCRQAFVEFRVPISGMAGRHSFSITIDPEHLLGDRQSDNIVNIDYDIRRRSLIILEPDAFEVTDPKSTIVRVIDILSATGQEQDLSVEYAVCLAPDTTTALIRSRGSDVRRTVDGAPSLVDWTLPDSLRVDSLRTYWIGAWPRTSTASAPTQIAWQPVVFVRGAANPERHRLLPDILSGGDPSVTDSTQSIVSLPRYPVPITVLSGGRPTSDPVRQPYMSIRLRDSIILENSFRQGLNIVVFAPYDTVPRAIRRYDTSPLGSPVETGHNGYARECIRFIRDSVGRGEFLVMVACDESFTRFKRDTLLGEFVIQLQRFGAKLADSVQPSSSYVLVGSVGSSRAPYTEMFAASGAIVRSTVDLPFSVGSLQLPLPTITAGSWKGATVTGRGSTGVTIVRTGPAGAVDTVSIKGSWKPESGYRYQPLALSLLGDQSEPHPIVEHIDLEYTPRPQLINIGSVFIPPSLTRGDTFDLQSRTYNARRHHGVVRAPVRLYMRDTAGAILAVQNDTISVGPVRQITRSFRIPSNEAPSRIECETMIDPDGLVPMQHRVLFRWKGRGTVSEDTAAPLIRVFADGVPCNDGLYVQNLPRFEVLVSDSCRLPIESDDNLTVFVNGSRIRRDNVQGWEFIGTDRLGQQTGYSAEARAVLRFQFPMESGENLVIVRARDVSGNADTSEISLYLADRSTISDLLVYPNPGSRQGAFNVQFDAVLIDSSAGVRISTFDIQGRLFSSRTVQVASGRTQVKIDPASADYALGPGVYTLVAELLATDGQTLSTVTRNLLVTP